MLVGRAIRISVCGVWAIVVYCSVYFGLKFGLMDSCQNVIYTHTLVSLASLILLLYSTSWGLEDGICVLLSHSVRKRGCKLLED